MSLFDSYRAVGLITSGRMTPVRRLGDAKNFVTCPAGRAFYVYDCEKLTVSLISKQVPASDDITALAASGSDLTYVAAGKRFFLFDRANCVGEFKANGSDTAHENRIDFICSFGASDTVVTVDHGGRLKVWISSTLNEAEVPECDLGSNFRPTFVLHPRTYLNKLLIGGECGLMQLWNFRTGKLVHTFKAFSNVSIECAEQSPAVDVVAVGLADGTVVMHNLRFDKSLFSFRHASKSRVTSLAFFTEDADTSLALLASGTQEGEVALWDLNTRTVLHSLRQAHARGVTGMQFLPGEFVLLTCGRDNSLRAWQLDSTTYQLRKLKSREGHWRAPVKVRFHPQGSTIATLSSGSDGRALQVVSAGADRTLRSFHCALDNHAKELSQKSEDSLLPRITSIATSEAREKDWYNIVTTHEGDYRVRVWRFETGVLGEGFLHMRTKGYANKNLGKRKRGGNDSDYLSTATSCMISDCGNFAYVGSQSGIVSKYNLQSGRFMGSYPKQIWDVEDPKSRTNQQGIVKRKKLAQPASVYATTGEARTTPFSIARDEFERHSGAVTGLCVDGLDDLLITAGLDGKVRFWDCETEELLETLTLHSPITQVERSRDGGLVALGLEDMSLAVLDPVSKRIVRNFRRCHQGRITDICFSPDSRWLLSSSLDQTLRLWDLSTARCIDWMSFPSAVTSMSFSPSNEYLATSHVDCMAICLWANKVHYGLARADRVIHKPITCELPCFRHNNDEDVDEDDSTQAATDTDQQLAVDEDEEIVTRSKDHRGMVRLSEANNSTSRWFTLWHLDLIKERNKPIQPPEKPKQLPFFLPATAAELDATPMPSQSKDEKSKEEGLQSRILSSKSKTDSFISNKSALAMELEELIARAEVDGQQNQEASDEDADEVEQSRSHATRKAAIYTPFVDRLKAMTASAVDFELRSLSFGPEDEEGARALEAWLTWLLHELQARTNFEMVQSILGRLIRVHGESLQQRPELRRLLGMVRDEQAVAWKSLHSMLQKCLCYVESFSQLSGF